MTDPPSTLSDAAGAQSGDPLSWERLEQRLRPWLLLRLASTRIPYGWTADDVVSATFGEMYRDIGAFEVVPGANFRGWVETIMRNQLTDLARREGAQKRRAPGLVSLHGSESADELPVHDAREHRASMIARYQELSSDFRRALAELGDEKRQIIELHLLNGLAFAEIAQRVGRNKAVTVKSIFHRTMATLRERLAHHRA
jgi:RNA polymerase sigma factor (sigma-70 family)